MGIILKKQFINSLLEVRRVSDRTMCMKLEIEGVLFNVISAYVPQVEYNTEEKKFWNELDEEVQKIPGAERGDWC